MIIAASLLLGICSMSFAQAALTKSSTDHRPGKMSIIKKDKPAGTAGTVSPVAKTNTAVPGKSAGTVAKSGQKSAGTQTNTAGTAPGQKNKVIGKKNKAAKKIRKANKKTAKPVKTEQ